MNPEIDKFGNVIHWNSRKEISNISGPATISKYKNGNVSCESYFKNGLCHREDGPSVIVYDYDDKGFSHIIYEAYYLNGVSMTAKEHRDAWDISNRNR